MKKYKNRDMYTIPIVPVQPIPVNPMPVPPGFGDGDLNSPIREPVRQPIERQPEGPPVFSTEYLQGYLKSQIGKFMRVDFLMGTGTFIDKEGVLLKVGVDYIVLRETKTGSLVTADLYSIKFVEIPEIKNTEN